MNDYKKGLACGLGAYVLWGVLPVYWKLLDDVLPFEILSSRFMWSCVFVALLIIFQGKLPLFLTEVKSIFSSFKTGAAMVSAAFVISINWGSFIWAVNNGHIVETSMGYYINPLVSVLAVFARAAEQNADCRRAVRLRGCGQHGVELRQTAVGIAYTGRQLCAVRAD